MTRTARQHPHKIPGPRRGARPDHWALQDAKARLSELVRRVRSEGPQHVTVHGREEVVVISVDEFRRLVGVPSGKALIEAMQASPYRDIDLEPERMPMPVRDVKL
jgi:prevent-host-death family protein